MSDVIQFKGLGLDSNDLETVEHLSDSLRRLYCTELIIDVEQLVGDNTRDLITELLCNLL
jgi:hypothetical protein